MNWDRLKRATPDASWATEPDHVVIRPRRWRRAVLIYRTAYIAAWVFALVLLASSLWQHSAVVRDLGHVRTAADVEADRIARMSAP